MEVLPSERLMYKQQWIGLGYGTKAQKRRRRRTFVSGRRITIDMQATILISLL